MKSFVCFCAILAVAKAFPEGRNYAPKKPAYAPAPAPVPVPAALKLGPSKPYAFAYEVIDPLGDTNFGHRESSDGVVVEGEYRVVLPDGRTQIVTYRADDVTGYVADVRYEGDIKPFVPAPAPVPVPVAAKSLAPRPIAKRNENTEVKDFKVEEVPIKTTHSSGKRHQKHQKPAKHVKQAAPPSSNNQYYNPQPYRPF